MTRHLYYISFADNNAFRGACLVRASSPRIALVQTNIHGINPGGEAGIMEVPAQAEVPMTEKMEVNRLYSEQEIMAMGAKKYSGLSHKHKNVVDTHAKFIQQKDGLK